MICHKLSLHKAAAQPNLFAKSVSEFMIPIPDIEEQKKISEFLDNLINLINLHQRKLEALKNSKRPTSADVCLEIDHVSKAG